MRRPGPAWLNHPAESPQTHQVDLGCRRESRGAAVSQFCTAAGWSSQHRFTAASSSWSPARPQQALKGLDSFSMIRSITLGWNSEIQSAIRPHTVSRCHEPGVAELGFGLAFEFRIRQAFTECTAGECFADVLQAGQIGIRRLLRFAALFGKVLRCGCSTVLRPRYGCHTHRTSRMLLRSRGCCRSRQSDAHCRRRLQPERPSFSLLT